MYRTDPCCTSKLMLSSTASQLEVHILKKQSRARSTYWLRIAERLEACSGIKPLRGCVTPIDAENHPPRVRLAGPANDRSEQASPMPLASALRCDPHLEDVSGVRGGSYDLAPSEADELGFLLDH